MPIETINGTQIFLTEFGSGDPLVLVHGSWVDHMEWPFVVPGLAQRFRVVVYDRRGHSQSERLPTQGSVREDVADLAAIIERAGAPAHVLGNSMGASISLRLAAERPELIRTLIVHEPPLFDLLRNDPATEPLAEELDAGILPVINELADPEALDIDLNVLSRFDRPVLLGGGSESPPFFAPVLDKLGAVLPNATRKTLEGDGHLPHLTHPQEYVAAITEFIDSAPS